MGSQNSKIARNSFILYIRLIVVLFLGIVSARYILQALGASDFGLYNVVGGIVSMMAVLNSVMVATTYRFIAVEIGTGNKNNINKIFNISLTIHIILAIIVLLVAETLGVFYITHYLNMSVGKIDDALFVFHLSILSTVFTILSVPFQGLIIANERFKLTASVEILRSVLALGAALFVFFFDGDKLRMYAILIATISILPAILYWAYSNYKFLSLIKWNFQKQKSRYREMVAFSGWLMFGAVSSVGEIQGSVLLINYFFGTVVNAGYGIATQINNMIKMFAQSLNQASIPQITISHSEGKIDRSMKLVIFSSKYSFFLMLLPSVPILLETDFILELWLKKVPVYTAVFIQIMIVNALIATMNSGIYSLIHATGRIKFFQIILGSITLLGLPVSYIFFKYGFPVYSLLLIYTVFYLISFFAVHILVKRILHIDLKEFIYKAIYKMLQVCLLIVPLFFLKNLMVEGFFQVY